MLYLPFLLVVAIIGCCIETDISVPGFPAMVQELATTSSMVQLTLSINFIGFCIAGLFWGPLSDSYGRRTVLLWANIVFLLAAIGTTFSQNIETLIFWRLLQGFGASASVTLVFAMIGDAYEGAKSASLVGVINSWITAIMAFAPIAGGFLVEAYGWRSTYSSVAVLGLFTTILLYFCLPETNKRKAPLVLKEVFLNYLTLAKSAYFLALTLIPSIVCGGYMAFVASAVFFYINVLSESITSYTMHQSIVIACFSFLSMVSGKLNTRYGSKRMTYLGALLSVCGGASLLVAMQLGCCQSFVYTATMALFALGVALCYGVTFAASMEVFPEIKGAAAALGASLRLVIVSACIWLTGAMPNEFFGTTALIVFITALMSGFLTLFILKQKKVQALIGA